MHIILENFRGVSNRIEKQFNPNSFIHLRGQSGSGKTTVFNGILFALYGSKDVGPSAKVTLTLNVEKNNIKIERSKSPDHLVVTIDENEVLEDNVASDYLINRFYDKDTYKTCSYVAQNQKNHFLECKKENRMNILENILDSSTREYNKKQEIINKNILVHKNELNGLDKEVIISETKLKCHLSSKLSKDDISNIPHDDMDSLIQQQIHEKSIMADATKNHNIANETKKEIDTLKYKLTCLDKKLINNPASVENQLRDVEKSIIENKVVDHETKSKIQFWKNKYLILRNEFNIDENGQGCDPGAKKDVFLDKIRRIKILNEFKTNSKFDNVMDLKNSIQNAKTKLVELESQLSDQKDVKQKLEMKLRQIKNIGNKIFLCPSCNDKIVMTDDGKVREYKLEDDIVETEENIHIVTNEIPEYDLSIANLELQIKNIKNELSINESFIIPEKIPKKSQEYYKNKCNKIDDLIQFIEFKKSEDSNIDITDHITQEQLRSLEQQKKNLILQIKSHEEAIILKTEYEKEILELNTKIVGNEKEIVQNQLNKLTTLNEQIKNKVLILEKEKLLDDDVKLKTTLAQKNKQLGLLQTLKSNFIQAKTIYVERILSTLNSFIQEYTEVLFPDDPMKAQIISSFVSNNKENTNSGLLLDIEYRGSNRKFSNLSGGEKTRVSIAFTLAFNRLSGNPFLLIDEPTESIQDELRAVVIDTIKLYSQSQQKTIIMTSHIENSEEFDDYVSMDE